MDAIPFATWRELSMATAMNSAIHEKTEHLA